MKIMNEESPNTCNVVVESKNFFANLGDGVCVFNSYCLTLSELTQF